MSAVAEHVTARLSSANHRRPRRQTEQPMPATRSQLDDIRAVLKWARNTRVPAGERVSALAEALEAAIAIIEQQPTSLFAWVIAALTASMKRAPMGSGYTWIVVNRQLHDEALDTIAFLAERNNPSPPVRRLK